MVAFQALNQLYAHATIRLQKKKTNAIVSFAQGCFCKMLIGSFVNHLALAFQEKMRTVAKCNYCAI